MEYDREFLTGTVGVLILGLLTERAMYAYEMLQEAESRSKLSLQLKEGTLYPALHQMERDGLLKATWRESDAGRQRKYYSLTALGRRGRNRSFGSGTAFWRRCEPFWVIAMDERTVAPFVERIVRRAQIPSRAQREDLRRELLAHFEDAAAHAPEAVGDAMRRFGSEEAISDSLRLVYHWDYLWLYFAKITLAVVASMAAALLVQVLVNLRVEVQAEVWRLAPGFSRAAAVSAGVVLGLVTAWEVGTRPFNRSRAAVAIATYMAVSAVVQWLSANSIGGLITPTILVVIGCACSKLAWRPARLLLTFAGFAAALYGIHVAISVAFGPARAFLASAALVVVWSSTVFILTRLDHVFVSLFDAPGNGTV